eukprot:TRINITY_DN3398_c0_g1_i14.p1 TRINITY_DN3398_c0_g1~~TRINITY_DN3398_c0_g1_i14.p1  ORF type:complete len:125 (+),score=25.15 TRINITY_DN3398_c0_g1_i14:515-889(+)
MENCVNTSLEPQKSGIHPKDVAEVARLIHEDESNHKQWYQRRVRGFSNLELQGLMTIGKYEGDASQDFQCLVECRREVARVLNKDETDLVLSMGMSADYELAIKLGSTNVRVGSTIFGERIYVK